MEYRNPRVCATCWQPWFGVGPICNDCVQTQSLTSIAANKSTTTSTYYTGSSISVDAPWWPWAVFAIAFGIAYACHWPLARMFVNIIKAILWFPMGMMLGWTPDFSM